MAAWMLGSCLSSAKRYAEQVDGAEHRVLLIDFCGAEPMLALMQDGQLASMECLPDRGAAAGWLSAVKRLLSAHGLRLSELGAVGVVAGPGSFTGVRTGLAAAKGLCEAAGLKLAAVSRLAVLAHVAADNESVAILHAGRGQVYVQTPAGESDQAIEALVDVADLDKVLSGRAVVLAEPQLAEVLAVYKPRLVELGPAQILPLVQQALGRQAAGGYDTAACHDTETGHHTEPGHDTEANYVRSESQIYRKPGTQAQMADAPR